MGGRFWDEIPLLVKEKNQVLSEEQELPSEGLPAYSRRQIVRPERFDKPLRSHLPKLNG
tara:strand:- start:521 stop:697 length:177 start_codon:yes stop_codon:yes gene_type:complete